MNKKVKSLIQYVILVGIGILLVYLSFKRASVSFSELKSVFSDANWFWVSVSLIVSFLSHFARAYRWNYLLENYGHKADIPTSVSSVLIGYLANYGLPRMGEISRCAVISKYNRIPFDIALGTVIAERVVDVVLMLVVFFLVVIFQYSDLQALVNQYIINPFHQKFQNVNVLYILLIVLVAGAGLYLLFRKKDNQSKGLLDKIILFIQNIIRPLLNIHKINRPMGFWAWSMMIWLLYFLSMYTCAFSMNNLDKLNMLNILVLFLFGTLGVIVTPGGIGAYHLLITEILLFYGIDKASAVAFPWLIWGTQFLLILISGGISFIILPAVHSDKNKTS